MEGMGLVRRWGMWGVIAACVLAAGRVEAQEVTPRAGSGKTWESRNESLNRRVKEGNVGMVFIGDSVVQEWIGNGTSVWKEFYEGRRAVNLGIAGDRAENIVWRLEKGNLEGIAPKLAVVMMGTDYAGESTAEEISAGVKTVVEKVREKLPRTKVLVVGILPHGDDARRGVMTKANEAIGKLADKKTVFFHDIGFAFTGADGKVRNDMMDARGRLSAKGYQALAEWLDDMVTTTMGEQEDPVRPVPLSSLDWWHKKVDSLNERVKQGNVDLIFIGDSITNGWDNEGKAVWAKYYGKRNAANLGISCDRTQNVLWRLDHGNLEGIAPKLAVVMIGSNNSSRSKVEEIPLGVKAIVKRVRTNSPKTKVLLLAIFPRGATKEDRWRQVNEKVNVEIAKFADGKTVFFMDINDKLMKPDGTVTTEVMRDLLHPSTKGYEIWAEAIEGMVAKLMGEATTK